MRRRIAASLAVAALLAVAVRTKRLRRRRADHPVSRISRAGRNAQLARIGLDVGSTYAAASARKLFASAPRRMEIDAERQLRTAEQIAERLGHMKGALMKVGQMASYLDDGLPEPVRLALAELQANAPPMSAELAAEVITSELGRPPEELFLEWDPEPIAAASIGQVHRAVFRDPDSGAERAVAVKVQYPGVAEAIAADLQNTDLIGMFLRQTFSSLDPAELVAEIKQRLAEELDYRRERDNQQRFVDFYRGHPYFSVPAVVHSLCTGRVLTTDLAVGATWREALTWEQDERDLIGEGLFRFVFRSLYRMQAFNGDPHPGNYLFHGDGRITFLDFGLVRYFSGEEIAVFAGLVKAAAVDHDPGAFRDARRAGRLVAAGRPGRHGRGRRLLQRLLRSRCRGRPDDVDQGVRQPDRSPHLRPHEPDRPVRHGAAGVRVHPAHQPRALRPARRSRGDGQLSADGRGAVAVRRRCPEHGDGACRARRGCGPR